MSSVLPAIFLIFVFLLPIALAMKLCGWRDITAFLLAIFIVPCALFCAMAIRAMVQENQPFDAEALAMGAVFGFAGLPIYFFIVIPIFYQLKKFSTPLYISFPASLTAVMFALYLCLIVREVSFVALPIIATCSVIHALLILWLISKINLIFPPGKSQIKQ